MFRKFSKPSTCTLHRGSTITHNLLYITSNWQFSCQPYNLAGGSPLQRKLTLFVSSPISITWRRSCQSLIISHARVELHRMALFLNLHLLLPLLQSSLQISFIDSGDQFCIHVMPESRDTPINFLLLLLQLTYIAISIEALHTMHVTHLIQDMLKFEEIDTFSFRQCCP